MVWPNAWRCLHVLGGVHERTLGQADAPGGHDGPHGVEARAWPAGTRPPRRSRSPPARGPRRAAARRCRRPARPSCGRCVPTDTPSQSRSTMKPVIESWARDAGSPVLANTVYQSACTHAGHPALGAGEDPVALVARPLVGHGPGAHAGHVAAGLGLGQPEAAAQLARWRCRAGTAASARRCRRSGSGPVGSRVSSSIRAAVLEYLATSSMAMVRPRMPAPDPPSSVGQAQAEQVGVPEGVEDVLGVLTGRVDLAGPGA